MYDMKELALLAAALTMRNIPFKMDHCCDGWGIIGKNWDAAINGLTMGHQSGLLELFSWDTTNGVYGCITASEVLEVLENEGLIPPN